MPVQKVTVDLYEAVIKSVLQDDVGREVTKVTIKILNRARVLCPVDTGNLRASHQFRLTRRAQRITGEVFTKVKYALPVHDGRGWVHITPKNKQALAFVWHGQPMVRKSVWQPPRKARPWLRQAMTEIAHDEGWKVVGTVSSDVASDGTP